MRKILPVTVLAVFILVSLACQSPINFAQKIPSATSAPVLVKVITATPSASTFAPLLTGDAGSMENLLVHLYEQVNPGVVAIQVINGDESGVGSGFVFDKEGHIVTNYHVVENAADLEVDFPSGIKTRGRVIATDLDSDLAVVKVELDAADLFPLPLGDSDTLKVGMQIVAIGNPFGLSSTMTLGIVSAKGRTLDSVREAPDGGYFTAGDIIQTDAAINPGNSGGPLVNLNGEVIGVSRAIRTESTTSTGDPTNSGIGFAISVNILRRVVPVLIEKGAYEYPYLGVSCLPEVSLLEQEALDLPSALGAYVTRVVPDSPAANAGLRAGSRSTNISGLQAGGDLITMVDGKAINTFGELLSYLMTHKGPGDTIDLTILRGGQEQSISFALGSRP